MTDSAKRYLWGLSLRDAVILALIAAATSGAKLILKFPLRVPGHFNLVWMSFLILGCALVPRRGAGTVLGVLTGVLAFLFGFGHEGLLGFLKWLSVGLSLEAFQALIPAFSQRWYAAAGAGGVAAVVKTVLSLALFVVFGFTGKAVEAAGAVAVALNFAFGAAGGLLGWAVWRRVS